MQAQVRLSAHLGQNESDRSSGDSKRLEWYFHYPDSIIIMYYS